MTPNAYAHTGQSRVQKARMRSPFRVRCRRRLSIISRVKGDSSELDAREGGSMSTRWRSGVENPNTGIADSPLTTDSLRRGTGGGGLGVFSFPIVNCSGFAERFLDCLLRLDEGAGSLAETLSLERVDEDEAVRPC